MTDTIENIKINPDTITDIYAESAVISAGIVIGDQLSVEMLGQGIARLYTGEAEPVKIDDASGYTELNAGDFYLNDRGDSGLFVYSRLGCTVNIKKVEIDSSLSRSEEKTIDGCKFTQVQEFIVDIANPLYVLYELPSGTELTVELIKRLFKTDTAGADMLILWDFDISTATKTTLQTFNENNEFRWAKDAAFEVSLLNPSTLDTLTGVRNITGAATIIDDGIIRESSFISTSGVGSNTTGDVDPVIGFRRYKEGTGYLFKVTSRANSNKISVGYTWTETGC